MLRYSLSFDVTRSRWSVSVQQDNKVTVTTEGASIEEAIGKLATFPDIYHSAVCFADMAKDHLMLETWNASHEIELHLGRGL